MTSWDAATFDGAREAMADDVARTTALQRLLWLGEAQRLAASTGALQAEQQRRATEQLARWHGEEPVT